MNKTSKTTVYVITGVLFLLSCFFMYDFYKCLSGFIANGFREPLIMLPLILSYLAPVISFLFFFYDFYNKKIDNKLVRIVYSIFILAMTIFNFTGIISNFTLYASNNMLGAYDSLLSIIVVFPYDAIIINGLLLLLQGYNIFAIIKPDNALEKKKVEYRQNRSISIGVFEYLGLCIIAIFSFVFIAAAIGGCINAVENALYDAKYIFLMLWIFLVPLVNLSLLVYKIEKRRCKKTTKIMALSSAIGLNILFGVLVFIFERIYPDFMIYISKPLFMIAFSVSLPIEQLVMFVIMGISTIIFMIRLLLVIRKDACYERN